jgi:hypothetical protein
MSTITQYQGKALAKTFHSAFKAGFPTNNHEVTMKDLFFRWIQVVGADGFGYSLGSVFDC